MSWRKLGLIWYTRLKTGNKVRNRRTRNRKAIGRYARYTTRLIWSLALNGKRKKQSGYFSCVAVKKTAAAQSQYMHIYIWWRSVQCCIPCCRKHTNTRPLTLLGPQYRFGDKLLIFRVFCPHIWECGSKRVNPVRLTFESEALRVFYSHVRRGVRCMHTSTHKQ